MKKLILAASASAILLGATMANAVEIAGNVTLATDYKFRGISQTSDGVALQGGFDAAWDSGFYLGTWGSNVDFANSLELDYYGGYKGSITEDVVYDVGLLYYSYPQDTTDPHDDYLEAYGSVSFKGVKVGVNYSDDYYAATGKFTYVYAKYSYTLPYDISLGLHAGYNDLDKDGGFLSSGEDNYVDYSVGLSKAYAGVNWGLTWVDTNLGEEDVYDTDWADGSVILSVTKSM